MSVSGGVQTNIVIGGTQSGTQSGGKLKADFGVFDILGHLILWIILSVITLGIGLFFFPYSFGGFVLNRIYIADASTGNKTGQFECKVDLASQIGHVILWIIISVLTIGIGYVFYLYKVWGFMINKTRIVAP